MEKIILASASARRSQILSSCGIEHIIVISGQEETMTDGLPVDRIVLDNAVVKAEAVAGDMDSGLVIGADTLVECGEHIIGKPGSAGEAREMLARFSGQDIKVYTGICLIDVAKKKRASCVDISEISVVPLAQADVDRYFRLLGPYDKAGGFSIEGIGSMIFDNIKGSYFNILGLSMMKLNGLFRELGLDMLDYVKGNGG